MHPIVDFKPVLDGYSLEINPSESRALDLARESLPLGTETSLPWIPGANPQKAVEAASALRKSGLIPVPHIAARHIESENQLQKLMDQFISMAAVDRVLLVGGDRDRSMGPYDSSLAVMQSGVLQNAGIRRIVIAGFPEGNPNIRDADLDEALASKVSFARSQGLDLSIITQFCFDAEPIVKWLRRIRAAAIQVPVRIGVAGPAGLMTLTRYAIRCGIGNSLRVLTEKPSFARLLIEKGPAPIIQGVVSATGDRSGSDTSLRIVGFHFFVFGGFRKTVDWINATRTRSFHPSGQLP